MSAGSELGDSQSLPLTVDIKKKQAALLYPKQKLWRQLPLWWAPSVSREPNQKEEPPLLGSVQTRGLE